MNDILTYEILTYELPQESEKVAAVIRALPKSWKFFDGHIIAPQELYDTEEIAENTRLVMSGNDARGPTLRKSDDVPYEDEYQFRKHVDGLASEIKAVFLYGKKVSSVEFERAQFDSSMMVDAGREIIAGFIALGYKGVVIAGNKSPGYRSEGIMIFHSRGTIELELDKKAPRESLDGIIRELERLGIKELQRK